MLHSKPMTVILDIGSYRTLAGIAGEENPHLSTYSYLTTDTSLKTQDPIAKFSVQQNPNIQSMEKTDDEITSVFESCNEFGQVDNYNLNKEAFESFIEIILAKNLDLSGETLSVMITEDMATQPHEIEKQRYNIAQFLFQTLQIDSLTFMKKPMLSCFSVGRASGLVIDSGHSFTRTSIVEDGYTVYNKWIGYGGGTIHGEINELLNYKQKDWKLSNDIPEQNFSQSVKTFYKMLELEKIKHKFDTSEGMDQEQMVPEDNQIEYQLPDGNNITLNRSEIVDPFTQYANFYLKYLDFQEKKGIRQKLECPSFITKSCFQNVVSYRSLSQMALDTLQEYIHRQEVLSKTLIAPGYQRTLSINPKQTRSEFLQNIVLTGGNLLFGELATSTKEKLDQRAKERINTLISPVYNKNENRNNTSWVGGSIIAELPTFSHFWTSKKQWQEEKNVLINENPKGVDSYGKKKNLGGLGLINKKCA